MPVVGCGTSSLFHENYSKATIFEGSISMTETPVPIAVYLEISAKRTFAVAIDWPGWARSGKSEVEALQTLAAYGPRYTAVLQSFDLALPDLVEPPRFAVVERLDGNASTAFGGLGVVPEADRRPIDTHDFERFSRILQACWAAFDAAVVAARGHELRKGPRGGGRDLDAIVRHVLEAEVSYLGRVAWKAPKSTTDDRAAHIAAMREALLAALAAGLRGEIPARGPRGGELWSPRTFVRREAWHVLDHAWEVNDRVVGSQGSGISAL
jgi:hypothetical protein